jgi:tetratricopeptide (TPR) repeat protein
MDLRAGHYFSSFSTSIRATIQDAVDRLQTLASSSDTSLAARADESLGVLQCRVLGNQKDAEATLRRALSLDPDRELAAGTLVTLLNGQQRYADAAGVLQDRLLRRDSGQDRLLLAWTQDRLGRGRDAEASAAQAVELMPDDGIANLTLAALLLRDNVGGAGGDVAALLQRAGGCLDRAERALSTGRPTMTAEGIAYANTRAIYDGLTGDPGGAEKLALQVLESDRNDTQARDILGAVAL